MSNPTYPTTIQVGQTNDTEQASVSIYTTVKATGSIFAGTGTFSLNTIINPFSIAQVTVPMEFSAGNTTIPIPSNAVGAFITPQPQATPPNGTIEYAVGSQTPRNISPLGDFEKWTLDPAVPPSPFTMTFNVSKTTVIDFTWY